jgi:competence protein ComEC
VQDRLRILLFIAGATLTGAALSPMLLPEEASLDFLAVGQGDCTVFRAGGKTVLIDAGPAGKGFDAGKSIIVPELRRMGVQVIDLVLLSHPDADHIGGLPQIAKKFKIGKVVAPSAFQSHPDLLATYSSAGLRSEQIGWLSSPSSTTIGRFDVHLDAPHLPAGDGDNEGSMFVKISAGEASAVFTGDAAEAAEMRMLGRADWRAQILKAGHHGSRYSTSYPWLKEVKPTHVILSCGRRNSYGHPAKDTLQRIENVRAKPLRTDRDGTIRFSYRGGRFVLRQ